MSAAPAVDAARAELEGRARDQGLELSPATLEDVPALTALMGRVSRHDGLDLPQEESGIRAWLTMPRLDLASDTLVLREGGALRGIIVTGASEFLDAEGRVRCNVSGSADPAVRRRGLGRALLAWAEQRARELAHHHHPGAPAVARVFGGIDQPEDAPPGALRGGTDVRPVLAERGYARVRSWLHMRHDLSGALPPDPEILGLGLREAVEDDEQGVHAAHLAAFADHWGSSDISAEGWHHLWTMESMRRELSTLALDEQGRVLGYLLASEEMPGHLHVMLVGTRPEARGRGVARALLARTLRAAHEAGHSLAELEVDAESLTGATRLYEAVGFTLHQVFATYEKPLAGADS